MGPVVLLDDCFTTFNHPEVGQAAVRLLEAAGYEVRIVGGACCGRPAVSKGLLEQGRDLAQGMLEKLEAAASKGIPIVGVEPSCMTMLADDYLHMNLGDPARAVAGCVTSVESLLLKSYEAGRIAFESSSEKVMFHGHCQQKAIFGTASTMAALRMVSGLKLQELDSGCCGMAGSFGYDTSHFDLSKALAERVLGKAIREQPEAALLAAGTSCRAQVSDMTGANALHPLEFLAARIRKAD